MENQRLLGEWVVVTTDQKRRGGFMGRVFMGKLAEFNDETQEATLEQAQMCGYWSRETGGVPGLASRGPAEGSRVTAPVLSLDITGVTSVTLCSDEAVWAWQAPAPETTPGSGLLVDWLTVYRDGEGKWKTKGFLVNGY